MHTSFESLADGVVAIMSVRRDVDALSAAAFKQRTLAWLECGGRRLIIDLPGSDLVDYMAAAVVFSVARRARRAASRLSAATPRSGPPHA